MWKVSSISEESPVSAHADNASPATLQHKDSQLNASIMVAFKFHAVVSEVWTVGGNLWKIGSLVGHHYIPSAGSGKRPNGVPSSGLYTKATELHLLGFRLSLFSHPSLVFTRPSL